MVHVWDSSSDGTRIPVENLVLFGVEGEITVGDLVAARVRQEVERYNATQPERFEGVVQPEEAEQLLNGPSKSRAPKLDVDRQIQRARRSFARNGFLILLNGRQVEDLAEVVARGPEIELEFVRLVPLIGG